MNETPDDLSAELRNALELYREMLSLVERENENLRADIPPAAFETFSRRRQLLPRLERSLGQLKQHRVTWSKMSPAERAERPETAALLRQCQDTIMKILMLDRENEQALLRRGMLGPRHLPSHNLQRPHFVADLYRRQSPPAAGA